MAIHSLIIFIIISFLISVRSEKCIQKDVCSCVYEDGRVINLKPLDTKSFFIASYENNLTYYFHPCSDLKPVFPVNINITNPNECDKTSLCLLNKTSANITNLGKAVDGKFTSVKDSENILLFNNDKSKIVSMIHLGCTEYPEPILVFNKIDAKTNHLILFAKEICPVLVQHEGLSTGSVLVILLCTFTSVYLLGGAAILHLLRGARGKEMIPNIEFWSNLPGLVRDGAIFLQNGCKPTVISDSESYDRI